MPVSLINFLLETDTKQPQKLKNEKIKTISNINTPILNDIKYIVDDKILLNMLNLLNIKYLNNFNDWTLITTCLKVVINLIFGTSGVKKVIHITIMTMLNYGIIIKEWLILII